MPGPSRCVVRKLAFAKPHNRNQRYFDVSICRRSGEHPGHLFSMGKGKDHLVNKLIAA